MGTPLHLVEDRADVLADDAEEDQLDAAEHGDEDRQGGPSGRQRREIEKLNERQQRDAAAEQRKERTDDDRRLERLLAERDDAVESETDHPPHVVLAPPGPPLVHPEGDPDAVEADPADQATQKEIALA